MDEPIQTHPTSVVVGVVRVDFGSVRRPKIAGTIVVMELEMASVVILGGVCLVVIDHRVDVAWIVVVRIAEVLLAVEVAGGPCR